MELYIINLMGNVNKSGHPTTFSKNDEMDFLTVAMKCGQWSFPLCLMDLRLVFIFEFLIK